MNTITVSECVSCGARSVPFFGMSSGCRYNGGSHRKMIKVQISSDVAASTLKTVYNAVPWFDRQKFDKHAKPWIKELLSD